MSIVIVEHARSEEQRKVLEQIVKEGLCPFCEDNLFKYHKNPILALNSSWFATESMWPYENAARHILIISKRHIEAFTDILPLEWNELWILLKELLPSEAVESGALGMRFGDPHISGASVRHLHLHIIVPQNERVVRFKIG